MDIYLGLLSNTLDLNPTTFTYVNITAEICETTYLW